MFILVTDKPTPVDFKILLFVLTLILALEPLQIFYMLLLKSEFEVLQLCNFLLIIMNSLGHPVFLVFDNKQLHLDSLLHVRLTIAHVFFFFQNLLSVTVGCFFKLDFTASDAFHCILFTSLELTHLVQVQMFHLLPECFHLVTILGSLFNPNPRHLKLFQAFNLTLEVILKPRLTLLLILEHALLQRFERRRPFHILGL